ncbi:hypothetical protein D3C84_759590 [compost metagenome]
MGSSRRRRAKWLSWPSCSGVAVSSRTPGMVSANCSTRVYSGLALSSCQTRWWASSTTIRSQPAANSASWAFSSSVSHSSATSASCASSKGLLASLSIKRSASNSATCRLKRRRISTSHWCWRFSGTRISTRLARPLSNWRWITRPASMVLPRPTSSASSTRGAMRSATSRAMCNWCAIGCARTPPRPHSVDCSWRLVCSRVL